MRECFHSFGPYPMLQAVRVSEPTKSSERWLEEGFHGYRTIGSQNSPHLVVVAESDGREYGVESIGKSDAAIETMTS